MPLYRFEEVPEPEHHGLFEGCGCELLMAVGALIIAIWLLTEFWWFFLIIGIIIFVIWIAGRD